VDDDSQKGRTSVIIYKDRDEKEMRLIPLLYQRTINNCVQFVFLAKVNGKRNYVFVNKNCKDMQKIFKNN
jgi:hypothetical protein